MKEVCLCVSFYLYEGQFEFQSFRVVFRRARTVLVRKHIFLEKSEHFRKLGKFFKMRKFYNVFLTLESRDKHIFGRWKHFRN